jgi:hypothetical protein
MSPPIFAIREVGSKYVEFARGSVSCMIWTPTPYEFRNGACPSCMPSNLGG